MDYIPVSDNLSIEAGADSWRLVKDEQHGLSLKSLVVFNGTGLKLHPEFPAAQMLGRQFISAEEIAGVLAGWVPRTQNWHLGLYVRERTSGTALHETSELTWCELAAWRSGYTETVAPQARIAGETLARLLNKPLQIIEPERVSAMTFSDDMTQPSVQTNALPIREIKPMTLPINMGDWSLHASGEGLVMRPTATWTVNHWFRVVFFTGICIFFLVLGVGSLRSGLAPVDPVWLPKVAFGMALILFYSAVENLWRILSRRSLVIDTNNREVRSERALTHMVDWRVPFERVEYLLVSQEAPRSQGRRSREDPMQIVVDTWAHLYANDQFYLLAEIGKVEGKSWDWDRVRRHDSVEGRQELDLTEYDTPLHHAIWQIADRLGVRVFIDIR